jgi:hypothetical protein
MSNEERDAFAERLGQVLRAPEKVDPTLEERVMASVRHVAHEQIMNDQRGWRSWLQPRQLSRAIAALAAGIALFAAGSASGWRVGLPGRSHVRAVAVDTVHVVRFVLVDPAAKSVSVVGDFNQWTKGASIMRAEGLEGIWTLSIPLTPGRYEYAFIVDGVGGERWIADPFTAPVRDDFGTESSVISVGT